ncbi:MAG: leucine-rich repeat domain-containing protein [Lachnospira sp.]|nr:leucine-rich repeat domain-containing protein [Lachnospira sp.]
MKERIKVYLYNKTLKEIDMSDFSVIGDDIFAYRNDVVRVELPEGVVEIGNNAFENCERLEEVICPKSLKKIGEEAFADCINLKKVTYGEAVEVASNAFRGCDGLE